MCAWTWRFVMRKDGTSMHVLVCMQVHFKYDMQHTEHLT